NEVGVALAGGNHREPVPIDKHFSWTRSRVVVGGHYESVGTGRLNGKKIARLGIVDLPVEREKVPTLTNWSDDIGDGCTATGLHSLDSVERIVVGWTQEVGHARVGDYELLAAAALSV